MRRPGMRDRESSSSTISSIGFSSRLFLESSLPRILVLTLIRVLANRLPGLVNLLLVAFCALMLLVGL